MTVGDLFKVISEWPIWIMVMIVTARLWSPVAVIIVEAILHCVGWALGIIFGSAYKLGRRSNGDYDDDS